MGTVGPSSMLSWGWRLEWVGGECRTGGQEAKPFLLLAAALIARPGWAPGCIKGECWALERLVLWGLGHSGAAGICWRRQRET